MFYMPKYFKAEEIFPKLVIVANHGKMDQIWRLMDYRVLWTLDMLREYFGTAVCNDYQWGGKNSYRVYRPAIDLIDVEHIKQTGDIKPAWSSFTSQHCFGRAADCKFAFVTAADVRLDIRRYPMADRYKYITAIEDNVSWLHFDVRNWSVQKHGILFF